MKTWYRRGLFLMMGILLWVFYIFQEELSFYGIYTLFSYRVSEAASLISYVCLAATLLWCVLLLIKGVKRKNSKWDNLLRFFWFCLLSLSACIRFKWENPAAVQSRQQLKASTAPKAK